jgi:integrase
VLDWDGTARDAFGGINYVQDREREAAAQLWEDGDWVFTTPTGRPLNPRTDFTNWKKLCAAAGVRGGRLHDARHTAATVLLVLGVPQRAVMDLMGWANSEMVRRYQHVTDEVRADVANLIDRSIWDDHDQSSDVTLQSEGDIGGTEEE